jgi:phosphinothricin acetyltransferase
MIRKVTVTDAAQIAEIYNHFVEKTIITFEETPLTIPEVEKWIKETTVKLPWFVFEEDDKLLGYAHASSWKSRCAYRNSVESTVYLRPTAFGKGIGSKLYNRLLTELKELGFHAVIGGIALPNEASIALHEKFGFEKIGHFKEVGNKFNLWIDVGYWQLLIQKS